MVETPNPRLAVYTRERDFWAHAFVFDHLEAHPVDPSLIIYADFKGPKKRKIVFATPLTLVAQITSSTNVDYDLLSDFFMTFRQFMQKKKLLEYLHDRFLWAVARQGDVSTAVRVRTFVALRHWILNYMAEDFVPNYSLRADFCMLVNGLYDYLKEIGATGPRGLEQIAELKRCWRQYISLYFEDPYDEHASSHDTIQPGGRVDSNQEGYEVSLLKLQTLVNPMESETTKSTDNSRFTQGDARLLGVAQGLKPGQHLLGSSGTVGTELSEPAHARLIQISNSAANLHSSQKSSMIWSCSIPFRPAHPVASSEETGLGKQAPPRTVALPAHVTNPLRATRPKNIQQGTGNSPVSSNENRSPTEKVTVPSNKAEAHLEDAQAVSPTTSAPGDLIKGRTLLPVAPNVEYQREKPKLDVGDGPDKMLKGPGVRRMIGSIRRAVSNSKQTQGPALRHAHLERHGDQLSTVTTMGHTSLPSGTTSSSTQSARPKTERILGPLHPRTDLLLERSLESFNKAIAAAPKLVAANPPKVHEPLRIPEEAKEDLVSEHTALSLPDAKRGPSTGNVTTGSRSIVIGHEGASPPLYEPPSDNWMSGGLSTPKITQTDFDEAASDMAGFQAPLDDDEPIEVATDDGWQVDEPQWEMQHTSATFPTSSVYTSLPPSISGAYLKQETKARLGHQPSNSIDDPVLPEDPQPSRSLRRRNDRGNLRAGVPSFHERKAAKGPLPDALGSHPPSRPSSHVSMLGAEDLPPLPSPGVLGPSVEEQLKSMLFPDDPNEDGSPATALMKLEGRFIELPRPRTSFDLDFAPENQILEHDEVQDKYRHRHEHVMDANAPIHGPRPSAVLSQTSTAVSPAQPAHRHNVSEVSYNSIPLLERGITDRASTGHNSHLRIRESDSSESGIGYQLPARTGQLRAINPDDASEEDGFEVVDEPEVLHGLSLEDMVSQSLAGAEQSEYHDVRGDFASSQVISQAISPFEMRGVVRSYYDEGQVGGDDTTSEAMFHPLRHPSTPPPTAGGDLDAYGARISNGLLTPANSPPSRVPPKASFSAGVYVPTRAPKPAEEPQARPRPAMTPAKHSAFILRFRAEHIAKAMTVVEQSALAQINWRELIDLSWSKTGLEKVRDWSGFIMSPSSRFLLSHQPEKPSHGPKSVDIVIARFNVVVKWAVSEVLLTDDLFERVHCIQQYIRIAAACRKLRNFATTYQIATALVSADLASLRETWELVPPDDKAWLKEMEALVSPLKSFENVRREQEVVVPDAGGCIPFFGELPQPVIVLQLPIMTVTMLMVAFRGLSERSCSECDPRSNGREITHSRPSRTRL